MVPAVAVAACDSAVIDEHEQEDDASSEIAVEDEVAEPFLHSSSSTSKRVRCPKIHGTGGHRPVQQALLG